MFVAYAAPSVQKIFEDMIDFQNSKNLMIRKIGLEKTKAVKKKYNQIIAFSSFSSLLESRIGKMESLSGDMEDCYSLHLTANYRLIVAPDTESRSVEDLRICDTIIIMGVMDYHGQGTNNNWIIP